MQQKREKNKKCILWKCDAHYGVFGIQYLSILVSGINHFHWNQILNKWYKWDSQLFCFFSWKIIDKNEKLLKSPTIFDHQDNKGSCFISCNYSKNQHLLQWIYSVHHVYLLFKVLKHKRPSQKILTNGSFSHS